MHLEAVTQALDVGRVADAQKHLTAAELCLGVSSEVTGIITFRASAPLMGAALDEHPLISWDTSGSTLQLGKKAHLHLPSFSVVSEGRDRVCLAVLCWK